MKNKAPHPLLLVFIFLLLVPVCTQGQGNISLIMPPILAASVTDRPPPPPAVILPPVEWQGRIWQQNDNGNRYNCLDAFDYCKNLVLNGYSDWELPDKVELKSLVVCTDGTPTPLDDCPNGVCVCGEKPAYDPNKQYDSPTIDSAFSCRADIYWTSVINSDGRARRVDFTRGGAIATLCEEKHFVRCVRSE
jgi:hypothetical protein